MTRLDYFRLQDTNAPLYQRILGNITELIDNGVLSEGNALPAERQLSEAYGVTRMTLRQAIDELAQKGLVERRQGAGTFVTAARPIQQFTPTVIGFSQRMHDAGINASSVLLHRERVSPEPLIAHKLGIAPDHDVIVLKRLRLTNDKPLMLETSYLSYDLFPGLMNADLENESLYHILEGEYGMKVLEAEHTMEPTLPNAYEAQHLKVSLDAPAMLVRVSAYSTDRVPVEVSKAIVRGDRCRYFFRVNTRIPIME